MTYRCRRPQAIEAHRYHALSPLDVLAWLLAVALPRVLLVVLAGACLAVFVLGLGVLRGTW